MLLCVLQKRREELVRHLLLVVEVVVISVYRVLHVGAILSGVDTPVNAHKESRCCI